MTDAWHGRPLATRKQITQPLHGQIHYRLYDQTGQLLSFNSTNSLDSLVADIEMTVREHPYARIRVAQFDGPA